MCSFYWLLLIFVYSTSPCWVIQFGALQFSFDINNHGHMHRNQFKNRKLRAIESKRRSITFKIFWKPIEAAAFHSCDYTHKTLEMVNLFSPHVKLPKLTIVDIKFTMSFFCVYFQSISLHGNGVAFKLMRIAISYRLVANEGQSWGNLPQSLNWLSKLFCQIYQLNGKRSWFLKYFHIETARCAVCSAIWFSFCIPVANHWHILTAAPFFSLIWSIFVAISGTYL